MSGKFNIRLTIAGKVYPLTIARDKEEVYRKAEREINALVTKYKTRFRAETDDYLAMSALQIAVNNVEMELSRSLGDDIDKLVELDARLDGYIAQTEKK